MAALANLLLGCMSLMTCAMCDAVARTGHEAKRALLSSHTNTYQTAVQVVIHATATIQGYSLYDFNKVSGPCMKFVHHI